MARRTFTDDGYPCDPFDVSEQLWAYADKEGLCVVMRRPDKGIYLDHIPWRTIERAVADHKKARQRRRRPHPTPRGGE